MTLVVRTVSVFIAKGGCADETYVTGEVEVFIDGISVINVKGLILRTSDESCCKGLHFQTFFGGTHPVVLIHQRVID
jgi:hypothetical protein